MVNRALLLLRELIRQQPSLELEFQTSLDTYFDPGGHATATEPAKQRHLEWFLCDRASDLFGELPVVGLRDDWLEAADPELAPWLDSFLGARVGAFEVTGVEAGSGAWIRDMLGLGEYPLSEPQAASELELGDIISGRIYPSGDELFCVSKAAEVFRSAALLKALSADFERVRNARRGTPRVTQLELEKVFQSSQPQERPDDAQASAPPQAAQPFDPSSVSSFVDESVAVPPIADPSRIKPEEARDEAEGLLAAAGLGRTRIQAILNELLSNAPDPSALTPGAGDVLERVLNQLAFESNIDLEAARQALCTFWFASGKDAPNAPETTVLDSIPKPATIATPAAPAAETHTQGKSRRELNDEAIEKERLREALEALDQGRAQGGNVEQLFEQLEQELGLDGEGAEEEELTPAPEFTGVVGAMVEEFLWDTGRVVDAESIAALAILRLLSEFGQPIGVFEALGERELMVFCGCWLLEGRHLSGAAQAEQLLAGLEAFCTWVEEQHQHPLATKFGGGLASFKESLPRLAEANLICDKNSSSNALSGRIQVFELQADAEGQLNTLKARNGLEFRVALTPALERVLRPGDILRASKDRSGEWILRGCFPAAVAHILRGQADE